MVGRNRVELLVFDERMSYELRNMISEIVGLKRQLKGNAKYRGKALR